MSRPKIIAWAIYGVLLAIALFFALTAPAGATTSTTSFAASTGWTQIAQFTSGAAPQKFTSIPSTYSDLLLVYDNVTFASNSNLFIALSGDNGSTYTSDMSISAVLATRHSGAMLLSGYKMSAGFLTACDTTITATPDATSCGGAVGFAWRVSGGVNNIKANTTGTLNSGTITLYGR